MSFNYTDYHHHQFDRQFSLPLPMSSPTSCWYPQRQDVQFGYSYPDMAAVSNLETRLDNTDRLIEVLRPPAQPQPDPDPSYNQPHYSSAAMNTHLSGGNCQQPQYLNPYIDGQPLYPCHPPDEYEQRANNQLFVPQHPPYTGFDSHRVGEIRAPPLPKPPLHPAKTRCTTCCLGRHRGNAITSDLHNLICISRRHCQCTALPAGTQPDNKDISNTSNNTKHVISYNIHNDRIITIKLEWR